MARAKYEEWTKDPDKLMLLKGWAMRGLSDQQIAKNIGISRSTLNEWKKKYSDISDSLKKGKEVADIEVENALFNRAIGMTIKKKKSIKCKVVTYDKNGKKRKEEEVLKDAYEDVIFPPDTAAIIFYLTNKMPDDWKQKRLPLPDAGETEGLGYITAIPVDMKSAVAKIKEKQKEYESIIDV